MGVFRLTNETHNKKPVWSRLDGTQKLFYNNRKFMMMMMNSVIHIDITGGYWLIGSDPESNSAGVASAVPAGDLLPHQVRSWKFVSGGKLQTDPQLTVTGNISIIILLTLINN